LTAFLQALGVDGSDIPFEPADRAVRYRSLLAGRHMLVMLDNAALTRAVRDAFDKPIIQRCQSTRSETFGTGCRRSCDR
jgi:hypothetical protein